MTRPRLLDLFCGAGGCSVGYARAGYDVTGVDHEHHESYPDGAYSLLGHGLDVECSFIQADALDVLSDRAYLSTFDVVHTSPPCPAYSTITPSTTRPDHPELIAPVREALRAWGGAWLIENVEGARRDLIDPIRLCGSSFGLKVRRHRLFETSRPLTAPPCSHEQQGVAVGVYGDHPEYNAAYRRPSGGGGRKATSVAEGRAAMGIDWMSWADLVDAVPPAYTEHLGRQLLACTT